MSRPRQNGGVQAPPAAADPFAALVDVFAERVAGEILKRLEPLLQQVPQISINDSSVPRRGKGFDADTNTHTVGPIARSDPAEGEAGESDKPRNRQVQILRPVAAAKKLGVSKMTVYRLENAGMIPPRIKISAKCVGWDETGLDDYLRNRATARGSNSK